MQGRRCNAGTPTGRDLTPDAVVFVDENGSSRKTVGTSSEHSNQHMKAVMLAYRGPGNRHPNFALRFLSVCRGFKSGEGYNKRVQTLELLVNAHYRETACREGNRVSTVAASGIKYWRI
jgi:hypothetical protein